MRKLIAISMTMLAAGASQAQDYQRRAMPSEREQAEYVVGLAKEHWLSGRYNWYYNPLNQPANLSTDAVVKAIQLAASRWTGMCNITFNYLGTTTGRPYLGNDAASVDSVNIVGWQLLTGDVADAAAVTYSWMSGDAMVDADIVISPDIGTTWTAPMLDGVLTHELGHAIGVDHSNVVESVMSATPYHSANYMRTLRGDDAKACAVLYGAASTAASNRGFNWAEAAYPQLISPGPAVSATAQGYYYRYYPATNSYLGTRDGRVYYLGTNGLMYDVGTMDSYWDAINSWGY